MSDPAGFDPDQVFSSVWHAQLFGLTVHLYDQGVFTWAEWSAALGRQLRDDRHISSGQPSGHTQEDRYYLAWLAALTACLQDKAITDPQQVQAMSERWAAAYLATPHGQPVKL